ALGIRRRHKILSGFLTAIGVPAVQAEKDIEGLEHHISGIAVEKIEALLPKLKLKVTKPGAHRSDKP
ncbi:MAG TPA: iron dependent repressor, metal binding and dimerization domain protein, partial [Opitutaceae bacterium]|nr:iron dependent repressor, metal binding and dimerization domain protein [Opitutaceae bacterium]